MAWESVLPYLERLAVWRGYEQDLRTLVIVVVGIALYTGLVFAFYQSISKREAFHTRAGTGWVGRSIRIAENILVFPTMSFLYFALLACSLFVLAKSQTTYQILIMSMSLVAVVRVAAHVTENMSADLAKLVPLSLLAVILVDPGYLSLEVTWSRLTEAVTLAPVLARFFLLFLVLEAGLNVVRAVTRRIWLRFHPERDDARLRRLDLARGLQTAPHDASRPLPPKEERADRTVWEI